MAALQKEKEKKREILSSSYSVCLLVQANYESGLLFVRQRGTKQWGPIAGGIQKAADGNMESFIGAAIREYYEEAGPNAPELVEPGVMPVGVFLVESGPRTRFGLVLRCSISPTQPLSSYERMDSNEIDLVKLFSPLELLELFREPRKIYKPEFNRDLIAYWLREYLIKRYGNYQIYGKDLALHMAKQWEVDKPSQNFQLFPKDMTLAFLRDDGKF